MITGGALLRVTLVGAESTGKTTLARALAADLDAPWVPEYARTHLDRKRAPLTVEDVEDIARGQLAAEDEGRRRAHGLLIQDTDLVSTMVYARHYYGSCPPWIEEAARARRADLYLLHHPDVPWIEDGDQRERPSDRDQVHRLFEAALAALAARTVHVTGPWERRMEVAKRAIASLLSAREK